MRDGGLQTRKLPEKQNAQRGVMAVGLSLVNTAILVEDAAKVVLFGHFIFSDSLSSSGLFLPSFFPFFAWGALVSVSLFL